MIGMKVLNYRSVTIYYYYNIIKTYIPSHSNTKITCSLPIYTQILQVSIVYKQGKTTEIPLFTCGYILLLSPRGRKTSKLCPFGTYLGEKTSSPLLIWFQQWCKPFIPSRHIHSIIKHLVYYTTLGIVKINIFEHFKKYLNSTNIFLKTDNNFTQ